MTGLSPLFVLLAFGPASASPTDPLFPDPQTAKSFFDSGEQFRIIGQFDRAIIAFDEAIKLNPKNAVFFGSRGFCWAKRGDLKRAFADYDEAIKLDPKNGDFFRYRGNLWGINQEWDRAAADFDQAIRLNPNDPESFYSRAVVWMKKKEWTKVVADCDEVIRLDPKRGVIYKLRGAANTKLGRLDAALTNFDKAIELDPHDAESHGIRIQLHWKRQEWKKVIDASTAAIILGIKDPDIYAYSGSAWLMCDKRDYERALKDFGEALKLNSTHVTALTERSLLLASCPDSRYRDSKQAAKDAALACELTRWKDPLAMSSLAAACAEAGEFDNAVKYQKQALENPAFIAAYADGCERIKLYERKMPYRLPEK